MKDYYYILGVEKTATVDEIKKAHRKLSKVFHPDKNDGDEFLAERFKEIQEAYEILCDTVKRGKYDSQDSFRPQNNKRNYGSNFNPEIEYFKVNKPEFEFGQELTFSWRTINADKVTLKPFGPVPSIGEKTYKINDFKTPSLTVELIVENTNINRSIQATLVLKNKTHQDLYNDFKTRFESEKRYENQRTNNNQNSKTEESEKTKKKEGMTTLERWIAIILTMFFVIAVIVSQRKQ